MDGKKKGEGNFPHFPCTRFSNGG